MLNEIRKESHSMRKTKSSSGGDNDDEEEEAEENTNSCAITKGEEWKDWYPQEWIGWVMYGRPSDKPPHHWVTQTITEGPSEEPTWYTDETGKKASKKPPRRVLQRERAFNETTASGSSTESNTMLSRRIVHSDYELMIAKSVHDFKIIQLLKQNANTNEKREKVEEYLEEYLLNEADQMADRFAVQRALREKKTADLKAQESRRAMSDQSPNLGRAMLPDIGSERRDIESTPVDDTYDEQSYDGLDNDQSMELSSQMEFSQEISATTGPEMSSNSSSSSSSPSSSSSSSTTSFLSDPIVEFSIVSSSTPRVRTTKSATLSSNTLLSSNGRPPLPPTASSVFTRSRSPLKENVTKSIVQPVNSYRGKDWEYLNTTLHRKYSMEEPGLISLRCFQSGEAIKDVNELQDLKPGEVEDDDALQMTKM